MSKKINIKLESTTEFHGVSTEYYFISSDPHRKLYFTGRLCRGKRIKVKGEKRKAKGKRIKVKGERIKVKG